MPANPAQPSKSNPVMAAVASLFLGIFVVKGVRNDPSRPDVPPQPGASALAEPSAAKVSADRAAILRPFCEALFGEGTTRAAGSLDEIEKLRQGQPPITLGWFVATVPDPVETSLSFRFDESVDSIERALSTRGYVLERWRLPWAEPLAKEADAHPTEKAAAKLARAIASMKPGDPSKSHPTPGDPALLVFRQQPRPRLAPAAVVPEAGAKPEDPPPEFILVFLVTETPTQGVDRLALAASLDLTEGIRPPSPTKAGPPPPAPERVVRVLGPCFSGSMSSLQEMIREWLDGRKGEDTVARFRFDVVSGSASAFDKEVFQGAFAKRREAGTKPVAEVEFASTVHRSETIKRAILEYLGRREHDEDVAILSEINTGFGGSFLADEPSATDERVKAPQAKVSQPKGTHLKVKGSLRLQYPLHIAEIRERYQRQGIFSGGAADLLKATGELRGRVDLNGKVRDVLPDQTSEWTAVAENRVLTQTLKYLEDSRFKYIGIISTDPNDTVFIARLISRYCPDARVFTVSSDLLYLDPDSISDLRGMIVGSTYPLYAPNHVWSGSDRSSRGQVFSSAFAQGVYNAAILQAAKVVGDAKERDGLIEYAIPRSLRPPGVADPGRPPVWISVVGERALYPVGCVWPTSDLLAPAKDEDYLARPKTLAGDSGADHLEINRISAWLTFFELTSLLLLLARGGRMLGPRRSSPVEPDQGPLAILGRAGVFAGYLYLSGPLLGAGRVVLNSDGTWSPLVYFTLFLSFGLVVVASVLAPIVEGGVGGRRDPWARAEAGVMLALLAVAVGLAVGLGRFGGAWWPLALDRSAAITGGVSAYVPVWFLMGALGCWLYLRNRVRRINKGLSLPRLATPPAQAPSASAVGKKGKGAGKAAPPAAAPPAPVVAPIGQYSELLKRLRDHREGFEDWFAEPPRGPVRGIPWHVHMVFAFLDRSIWSWRACWPWVAMGALLAGSFVDGVLFRPLEYSDEGRLFDWVFRGAFALILVLFAGNFARVASAWHDLVVTLDGFAKILDGAFHRLPGTVSTWFIDPVACERDYRLRIVQQIYATRSLLDHPPSLGASPIPAYPRPLPEVREQLDAIEKAADPVDEKSGPELRSIRTVTNDLATYWAATPVGHSLAPPDPKKEPTFEEQLVARLEELIALHAARWIGGALGRIWSLLGFLVASVLLLLFATTSYPFPEQPRLMTVLGLAIVGLVVMVVRVVIGTNRDQVISRVNDTTPGKISWDPTLFSHLGTFVIPLLGVLAAISFEALDLFRAVLGPILRLFP